MQTTSSKKFFFKLINKEIPKVQVDSFGMHDFKYARGTKQYKTMPYYSLHYVISGKGKYIVNDEQYSLSKNSFFITMPHTKLAYFPDEKDPWHYFWFDIMGEKGEVEKLFQIIGFDENQLSHKSTHGKEMISIIEGLVGNTDDDFKIGLSVTSKFYEVCQMLYMEKMTPMFSGNTVEYSIYEIKNYIQRNYHNPQLQIGDIIKNIAMSHSYLCKVFMESEKVSIKRYLINFRLKKASELLLKESTVKEVAFAVGYTDESHFSKEFKKLYHITPRQYKEDSAVRLSEYLMNNRPI